MAARERRYPQWVSFSTPVKAVKLITHSYDQRLVSQVIIDSVTLQTQVSAQDWAVSLYPALAYITSNFHTMEITLYIFG